MRSRLLPVLLLMPVVCGCVRVTQDITVNGDGSGTLHIAYSVKDQDLQRMRQISKTMTELDPSLAPEDVDWLTAFDEQVIRREWAKVAHDGVSLGAVRTELLDGWRTMYAEVGFRTLQDLLDCGMIRDCHVALTRGPGGQYGFQQSINIGNMAKSLPAGVNIDTMRPLVSMMLKDFRADISFQSPGRILRSNADRIEGRRAHWSVSGEDPGCFDRIMDFDIRLLFEGAGLHIPDALMMN